MKSSLIIFISILLCSSVAFGQTTPSDNDEVKYEVVFIHKQFGDTIPKNELYNYIQYGGSMYTFKISGDTIYKYFDEDPPEIRHTSIDSISNGIIERPANLDSIQDINGEIYTKRDLNNNVVVINFWATWCGPCLEEIPELNRLVENCADKGVLFFAPTLENGQRLDDFLSRIEFNYKIVPQAGEISGSFGTFALPTHIIIDKNGIVKFMQVGADTGTIYEILSEEIEKYL